MPPTENGFMEANVLGPMIPLTTMIDFILQRTYHDLCKLAELLPQKTDLERKIEISMFLNKTKQLFVRLLALVRWTSSANKVDKCGKILSFLQDQQMIYIETADSLARLARETLVHARLPSFALSCAVDVLTTGSYPRLPHCIKEKIIPSRVVLPSERRRVITRLTQLIEHRIVTTDMPLSMCRPDISNGRVTFTVECEFKATLTLMSDSLATPWRLLDIEILVEDCESQEAGSLVHPQQVSYIHHIAQQRLMENEKPLQDLYTCLHYFCQSLQLEVLFFQSNKLINHRMGQFLKVDEYVPGKVLALSYWRDVKNKKSSSYKITILPDEKQPNKPLCVLHSPKVVGTDGNRCVRYIDARCLSMESLIINSIQVRIMVKMRELKRSLEGLKYQCHLTYNPLVINLKLTPALHYIHISVLEVKGTFTASLPTSLSDFKTPFLTCLNSNRKELGAILNSMRLVALKATYITELTASVQEFKTTSQNKNSILVKLFNRDSFYLMISFPEKDDNHVKYEIYEAVNSNNSMQYMLQIDPQNLYQPSQTPQSLLLTQELSAVISFAEQTVLFEQLSQQLNNCNLFHTGKFRDSLNKCTQLLLFNTSKASRSFHHNTKTVCRLVKRERYSFCIQLNIPSWPIKCKQQNENGNVVLTLNYETYDLVDLLKSLKTDLNKVVNIHKLASQYHPPTTPHHFHLESTSLNRIDIFYGSNNEYCTSVTFNPQDDLYELFFWTTSPSYTSNCHSRSFHHLQRTLNYTRSLSQLVTTLCSTQPLLTTLFSLPTLPFLKPHAPKAGVTFLRQIFTMVSQSDHHIRLFHQSNLCILDITPCPSSLSDVIVKWSPKKSQVFDADDQKILSTFMTGELKGITRDYSSQAVSLLEFVIGHSDGKNCMIVSLDTLHHGVQACMDGLSVKKYIQGVKGGSGKMESSGLGFKVHHGVKKVSLKLFSLQERQWENDDLLFLERYFELKVTSFPFNPILIESFFLLLHLPHSTLKHLLQVFKLELDRSKCGVQLLLTQPHGTNLDKPLGTTAIFFNNRSIFFILCFTSESNSLILPLCYDLQNNVIKTIDKHPNQLPSYIDTAIKRANEYGLKNSECCIFLAVREIMASIM